METPSIGLQKPLPRCALEAGSQNGGAGPETPKAPSFLLLVPVRATDHDATDLDEELPATSVPIYSTSLGAVLREASRPAWALSSAEDGSWRPPAAPETSAQAPQVPEVSGSGPGKPTRARKDSPAELRHEGWERLETDRSRLAASPASEMGRSLDRQQMEASEEFDGALLQMEKKWEALSESAKESRPLQEPARGLEERIAQLESRRETFVATLTALQEQHAEAQEELRKQKEHCEKLEAELASAGVTAAKSVKDLTAAKQEVRDLKDTIQALEGERAEQLKVEAQLKRAVHSLELQNSELQKLIDSHEVRVQAHSQASESVEADLVTAEKKNHELRTALAALRRENECVARERAEMEVENESLRRENGRVRRALADANSQLSSLCAPPPQAALKLGDSSTPLTDPALTLVSSSASESSIKAGRASPTGPTQEEAGKRQLDQSLVTAEALKTLSYRERLKIFEDQTRSSR
uniref:Uncharacterized protein n=1 Tax=Pinguiococcus pyrenoidosus TaxID=172671 RepID=A0A7R9YA70_9STRA|mmetsp:Transcript_13719/g.51165  ORF Transcript_13719/g.51165 Transcript_13719/m.51165 type:complete len:471 (+) Transcript_13719:36-1448(+)